MYKYNPLSPQLFEVSEKIREANRYDFRRRARSGHWSRLKSLLQAFPTALLDFVGATSVATITEPAVSSWCQVLWPAFRDCIAQPKVIVLLIRADSAIENRRTCDLTLPEFEQ